MKTFSSFHIKRICRAHTITSNVIFHILFNDNNIIFDVANIICMKIVWLILDVMRMHADISLHVIVNIIKLKRMQGSNYLSFGEQRLLFKLY